MRIWSGSLQKEVLPKDLPLEDLVDLLESISIDSSDCWMPETEAKEGYAAISETVRRLIREAVRRLKEGGAECGSTR